MTEQETEKLSRYFRNLFNTPSLTVRLRPQKDDSAELYKGEEFLGVIYKDEEDEGDPSYNFSMAILSFDLE